MNLKLLCSLLVVGLIASLDGAVMVTDRVERATVKGLMTSAIPPFWHERLQADGSGSPFTR